MSTFVAGHLVRSVGPDSFVDITDVPAISFAGGVTFDGVLTAAQQQAVWDRMTSRDDADQAARANLATLGAAVKAGATLENVAALLLAQNDYLLGVST